jgi:uncharacterized protein YkwD
MRINFKESSRRLSTSSASIWPDGSVDFAPHDALDIKKVTKLPCSHVMVNRCRLRHGMSTLTRSRFLDSVATSHAIDMSEKSEVFPLGDTVDELKQKLQSPNSVTVGQNVHRGYDLQYIQDAIEHDDDWIESRQVILLNGLSEFGMGSIEGEDGLLYMCQLFR